MCLSTSLRAAHTPRQEVHTSAEMSALPFLNADPPSRGAIPAPKLPMERGQGEVGGDSLVPPAQVLLPMASPNKTFNKQIFISEPLLFFSLRNLTYERKEKEGATFEKGTVWFGQNTEVRG